MTINKNEPYAGFEQDGVRYLWQMRRLWELTKSLPVFEYEVVSFNGFDKDVWFNSLRNPTLHNILEHYKKIENATFKYPIIISQEGIILDGIHRICRAYLDGKKTIPAVKFSQNPEPDEKIKLNDI